MLSTDHSSFATADLDEIQTLPALFRWRVEKTPHREAYRQFEDGTERWIGCSWHEIALKVEACRRGLDAEQLNPGDRIAILMPNGIEHVAMDQAALSRGLVPVPLHAVDNPESIIYILQDSGASLLFVASSERWETLAAAGNRLDGLKRVICAKGAPGFKSSDSRIVTLDQWLQSGQGRAADRSEVAIQPGDLAAIVYTSGTTGRPKGVMLSHGNIIANVKAIQERLPVEADDVFLSFLPLSHTFERTAGYYHPIAAGACVAYARSTQHLPEDLKTVRPTVLISVPRIYERFYATIIEHRASASWLERAGLDLTLAVGGRRFDARQHGLPPLLFDRLAWLLLKRIVADKVLVQLGGRLRVAVSGGAPIAWPIARLFLSLGLDLLQGYGMTETSPVVSTNTPDDNDPRSVGRPLAGVEIRIGENKELLVRAASVMVGYWHKPEETHRIIEADGWLHTGDQARIENGRIAITGRIKDIIVTSTGEKIAPADLETAIISDPLFEQAMVIGEQRPYLAVLVVLNIDEWQRERTGLRRETGGAAASPAQKEADFLLRRIAKAVKDFPAYATPRAVWWTTEPWTIANGLLTPTLKTKRSALEQRKAPQIAELYFHKGRPMSAPQAARA